MQATLPLTPRYATSSPMPDRWQHWTERWLQAGLIDPDTVRRIAEFESRESGGLRWTIVLVWTLGAILVSAGILLFVSANWDGLAPIARFALVVAMVAGLHGFAAFASTRYPPLATILHGAGTVSLGAGIALCGQIFHLSDDWSLALLLWAAGAGIGFWLLRDSVQLALFAALLPTWVWSRIGWFELIFPLLVSLAYLTATRPHAQALFAWIGGIGAAFSFAIALIEPPRQPQYADAWFRYALSLALPLAAAWWLRETRVLPNLGATAWTAALPFLHRHGGTHYLWLGLGCALLAWWGVQEKRSERINLGVAGFAATVLTFYFSNLYDRLDRSISLLALGLLFLGGGFALERVRRILVARARA